LFGVGHAQAQLGEMREHARQIDSGEVALGLDVSSFFGKRGAPRYAFLSPTVGASVRLSEIVIEGLLPTAYVREQNDPGDTFDNVVLGNVWLGLSYLPDCACGLSRLTLGIAAPTATNDSRMDSVALFLARAVRGDWDGFVWRDGTLPLVVGAGTFMELGALRIAWDGDLIFGLPGGERSFEFSTQQAGDASLRLGRRARLGARIHGVFHPTSEGDRFQSALSAYFRIRLAASSLGVRFIMSLDRPAGFAFADEGAWGLGLFYIASF
jgi:hypothetical protein